MLSFPLNCLQSHIYIYTVYYNEIVKNVETSCPNNEVSKVSKKIWRRMISKDSILNGLVLLCDSHTLLWKNGKYMVAGQSTALFSVLQRHLQSKTWEEPSTFSWAVVDRLLATGAWRFPWRHAFSLRRRIGTIHTPFQRQWSFHCCNMW